MNAMNDTDTLTPGAAAAGEPAAQPSLSASLWIAWFSVREMARRKRLISLALINLLPVLVVAAIRIWFPPLMPSSERSATVRWPRCFRPVSPLAI